jgi:nucleotide-binding universal stress UspA family protein
MKFKRARGEGGLVMEVSPKDSRVSEIALESWLKPHPNFRLKKIIAAVDFSEASKQALRYAISVAREFKGTVILVNVAQPYPVLPELPAVTPELNDVLLKEAKEALERWRAAVKDVPCRAVALVGGPATEVVALARKEDADLIIVGTHGRTGIAHAFLGSVAERIVRTAGCPTLVVREHERDFVTPGADDAAAQCALSTSPRHD